MVNLEQAAQLGKLYRQYLAVVKPLLAKIEATYEKFPIQVHNEIRSFNDHIARCYKEGSNDEYIEEQIKKARGHLHRIILDCYKLLNVAFKRSDETFEKQTKNIDLSLVSNGDFLKKYIELRQKAIDAVKDARRHETADIEEGEVSFLRYEKACNAYTDLENYVKGEMFYIDWIKRKYTAKRFSNAVLAIGLVFLGAYLKDIVAFCDNGLKSAFDTIREWLK